MYLRNLTSNSKFQYNMYTFVLGLVGILSGNCDFAFGQGSIAVIPMSKASFDASEAISFSIFNRVDKPFKIKYEHECSVDGETFTKSDCEKYLQVNFDLSMLDQVFTIPAKGRVKARVQVTQEVKRYILYKPLISPVQENEAASGVGFVFQYQPGFFFNVAEKPGKFSEPALAFKKNKRAQIVKFDFDLSDLPAPQVLSASAKIIDRGSKKLVRFVRLANQKIVDPSRKKLALQREFADLSKTGDFCYEMFLINHSKDNSLQKFENCSN